LAIARFLSGRRQSSLPSRHEEEAKNAADRAPKIRVNGIISGKASYITHTISPVDVGRLNAMSSGSSR
jgi:hypothetical protein